MRAARPLVRLAAGAGATWLGYAWGAHLLTPACAWRGPAAGRRLALTFDDGPDPVWTPRVLDLLARHDVRATFFLVGERAARASGLARAIADGGHEVGNHAWSHRSLWLLGPRRTAEEVGRAQAVLGDLAGRAPRHFRPPWGMVNAALFPVLSRHGLRCVFWSVQPESLRPQRPAAQVRRLLDRVRPGAIVDLHDADGVPGAGARLAAALPTMIEALADRGYTFVTVAELLADRG